jgi:hypothetical protein
LSGTNLDVARLRIPDTCSLQDCLHYWNLGDVERGLPLALKKWPLHFKPSAYRQEAVKWGKIRKVVNEFQDFYNSDIHLFEAQYPGLSLKYTDLVKAIDVEREKRNDLVRRPRKRHRI